LNDDLLSRLPPEERARVMIDRQLAASGWAVQDAARANLSASRGVAIREFVLEPPHGRVDYLCYVDGRAAGTIEAKPEGYPLISVEPQTAQYVGGLPKNLPTWGDSLAFSYESTGSRTPRTRGVHVSPPGDARCLARRMEAVTR
jgi:type I restriction enzyme R subunit